jgi:hypothetical protein
VTNQFLLGRWSIRRSIEDAVSGARGSFAGTAVFTPDDGGLAWVEEGILRWPKYYGAAGRTLRVVPTSGSAAAVYFSDGRFFHDLDLSIARSNVSHDCAPDRYAGIVDVTSPDSWRLLWYCDGPQKKLAIRTSYRRLAS